VALEAIIGAAGFAGRETVRSYVIPDEFVLRPEPPKPVKFATG
jgi:hypothetical protein